MRKMVAAPIALFTWMLIVSCCMILLQVTDIRLFVAIALTGLFVIVYLVHPVFSRPRYMRDVYNMTIVCMVLFAVVIIVKIRQTLGL